MPRLDFWDNLAERRAAADGINLFFGALIGSNLARAPEMALWLYGSVVAGAAVTFLTLAVLRTAPSNMRSWAIPLTVAMLFVAIGAEIWGGSLPAGAARLISTSALAFAFWFGLSFYVDTAPVKPPTAKLPPEVVASASTPSVEIGWITATSWLIAAVDVLTLMGAAVVFVRSPTAASPLDYFVKGPGLFHLLLAIVAAGGALAGASLAWNAARVLPRSATLLQRDDRTVMLHASWALSAAGLGFALVLFHAAQGMGGMTAPAASPIGETIGFFDLMTWLGTFVTLVVVIAGALVAIYGKRREDEAHRSAALAGMRQAWIDHVRETLVELTEKAHLVRMASQRRVLDAGRTQALLSAQRALELRVNPAEGHHAVLVKAAAALARHAGIEAQLSARRTKPAATETDWNMLLGWTVALGQLVLKIEWVVTSLGRDAIPSKAGLMWEQLRQFETDHANVLSTLASDAWAERRDGAPDLLNH